VLGNKGNSAPLIAGRLNRVELASASPLEAAGAEFTNGKRLGVSLQVARTQPKGPPR
jgi:hypothetical protein